MAHPGGGACGKAPQIGPGGMGNWVGHGSSEFEPLRKGVWGIGYEKWSKPMETLGDSLGQVIAETPRQTPRQTPRRRPLGTFLKAVIAAVIAAVLHPNLAGTPLSPSLCVPLHQFLSPPRPLHWPEQ
jgi:hypothetical protein